MNDKIASHVEGLFAGVQKSKVNNDIKEELLANLNDKYADLLAGGVDEVSAYTQTISGIGDIQSLIGAAEREALPAQDTINLRQKRGLFVSIGVALYIMAIPVNYLLLDFSMNLSITVFMGLCAIATGLIVYGNMIGGKKYKKTDDTFAEGYKEKISGNDRNKRLRQSVSSSLWSITVLIYLAYSFASWNWEVSWIIFIVAAVIQQAIIFMLSNSSGRRKSWYGILWTSALIIYFIVSFTVWNWEISWIIFIVTLAIQQIVKTVLVWGEDR